MATSGASGAAYNASVRTSGPASPVDSLADLEAQATRLRAKIRKLSGFVAETEKALAEIDRAIERASPKG